jgi:hypothetical protein
MSWLEIVFRVLVPTVLGSLAVWVGVVRIPWTPGDDEDD